MKLIRFIVSTVILLVVATADAGELRPFDQVAFDKLVKEGQPIVIAVHASWCPTCKAQKPIQTTLMARPEFKTYTLFTLDFDTDTTLLKTFKVIKQSTIVVFKGPTEVGRSIGDTNLESMAALMRKAG